MKPQILITIYDEIHNPYYAGGGAVSMHAIGKYLTKKYDVTMLVGNFRGAKDRIEDGINYHHIGFGFGPRLGQLGYMCVLPLVIMRKRADVVIENFLPPHSTMMLPYITKIPVIGITTLLDAHYFSKKYHLPFSFIERIGLKSYKGIIALSDEIAQRVRSINKTCDIHTIPNGIDSSLLTIKSSEKNYICFIGRIDRYQKGLDILLDAWDSVATQCKDYKLVIIGDGPEYEVEWLKQRMKSSKSKSIEFKGKIIGKRKNVLLSSASAIVAPSRFESFGNAVLECLALGKTVIRFDIPGFSWIPKNASVIASSQTSDALASSIVKVIKTKKLRQNTGNIARRFASKFTWEVIAKQYVEFIEEMRFPIKHE